MHTALAAGSLAWFVSRGSGLVLFALLSAVVALGVAVRTRARPLRLPGFSLVELHRLLALFAVVLLPLHVVTAIVDPYVHIGWWAAVVPFLSPYRRVALGLGTLAVDLVLAVVGTSLLRSRLGDRAWRIVHAGAYLLWPVALVHSLRAGADLGYLWAAGIEWGAVAVVLTAVGARLIAWWRGETSAPSGGVQP